MSTEMPEELERPSTTINDSYGWNAWRQWINEKNEALRRRVSPRKYEPYNTYLASYTRNELNRSLRLFVGEVRTLSKKELFAASSMYCICMSIQLYLYRNDRLVHIFFEPALKDFTDRLHQYFLDEESRGEVSAKLLEEVLWETRQLGAHSQYSLLNTVMYFNAKVLKELSVDAHMRMSFFYIDAMIHEMAMEYAREEEDVPEDVGKWRDLPRLFLFYRSKCPPSCRKSRELLYLVPKDFAHQDDSEWYSKDPLPREEVTKMLKRFEFISEIEESLKEDD